MIDDFEDALDPIAASKTAQGGSWYTFTDKTGKGASTIEPSVEPNFAIYNGEGYESNGVLSAKYALDKGSYEWSAYAALGASLSSVGSFDASTFQGFEYWFKGPAHRIRVEIPGVTDYDVHFTSIGASKTAWKKVVVDFADIAQEGWGDTVKFTPDQIDNLAWEIRGTTGDTGTILLDGIRFLDTIIYIPQNDMVIRDPAIPELTTTDELKVNTELNTRAVKYLTKGLNFTNWLEEASGKFNGTTWKYDESDVSRHASQGFKGLRLPIDLDLYVVDRANVVAGTKAFAIDPVLWTVLDSFDIWTKRHGMSFTIDYHQYDGSFTGTTVKDAGYRTMTANAWKAVASHFKNSTREDLFFELTNEPDLGAGSNTITATDWRALAQQMIDSIRTQMPTIPIIYGATNFYSLDNLIKEDVLDDEYIIYAFHFYDPFIFTHQGASWTDMPSTHDVPFPYTKEEWSTEFRDFGLSATAPTWVKTEFRNYYQKGNKNFLMNRILKVKQWAFEHQVPLTCNEWGAYQRTTQNVHLNNYNRTMGEIFTELDIAWQVWFGVFDSEGNLLPGLQESLSLTPP